MKLYFPNSRIPELAGLTPRQRKLVYRCGLQALLSDQPSTIWVCSAILGGSILVGALAGWLAAAQTGLQGSAWLQTKWSVVALSGLAGSAIGNLVVNQWLTSQLRPYLQRVLEKRSSEISQIS
jgi:uncharacterized membrane protein YeaQ/YmgE (transglycosylase-associated protein family)